MSCECSVPGVRESHEVAGGDAVGAPVSAAVSGAGGVALLLTRQGAVFAVSLSRGLPCRSVGLSIWRSPWPVAWMTRV